MYINHLRFHLREFSGFLMLSNLCTQPILYNHASMTTFCLLFLQFTPTFILQSIITVLHLHEHVHIHLVQSLWSCTFTNHILNAYYSMCFCVNHHTLGANISYKQHIPSNYTITNDNIVILSVLALSYYRPCMICMLSHSTVCMCAVFNMY